MRRGRWQVNWDGLFRGSRVRDKSFGQEGPKPQHDGERPLFVLSSGSSRGNGLRLRVSDNTHARVDAAAATRASLHRDRFFDGIRRSAAESIVTPILEDELNRGAEAVLALFERVPLAVCPWDFRRPRNEPIAIAFDYRCEFVPHGKSIAQSRGSGPPP